MSVIHLNCNLFIYLNQFERPKIPYNIPYDFDFPLKKKPLFPYPNQIQLNENSQNADSTSGLTLESLDIYSLLQIFDHLSISDLMNLSATSDYLSLAVEETLRKRFQETVVFLAFPSTTKANLEQTGSGIFGRMPDYKPILNNFGHSIKNLNIGFQPKEYKPNYIWKGEMSDLIKEQYTESFVMLNLKEKSLTILPNFIIGLKYGGKSFTLPTIDLGDHQMNINEMFPSLRHLYLEGTELRNTNNQSLHFPHLKILNIDILSNDIGSSEGETVIERLLLENPQIRSLTLHSVTPDFLKFTADNLKNLEFLEIVGYNGLNDENYHFHFEHMKHFKFAEAYKFSDWWPTNITFGNELEEIEIDLTGSVVYKAIDFIVNTSGLKKLQLWRGLNPNPLNENVISRLASAHLNVTEMYLKIDGHVQTGQINQLIRNSNELTTLNLYIDYRLAKPIIAALENEFGREWYLSTSYFMQNQVITLEKRAHKH